MFEDRADAGKRLALALQKYKSENPVVLAIPRGGVEVGYQVARHLHAQFDIVIARKLPFPDNPEAGFGALAEDGTCFIFQGAANQYGQYVIDHIIETQQEELYRRIGALRAGKPLVNIEGRTVILVDDGIAMGSTMHVCVTMCKNRKAKKIIVAAPVSSIKSKNDFSAIADDAVILVTPEDFFSVAQEYINWYDVSDRQVIDIIHQWEYEKHHVIGH